MVNDPVSGVFADTGKIHPIDHVGKHFRVRGPLEHLADAAGRPVYVQAGSSEDGRAFARASPRRSSPRTRRSPARRSSMPTSSGRHAPFDRSPDQIKILPGHQPVHRPARRSKPTACRTSSTI